MVIAFQWLKIWIKKFQNILQDSYWYGDLAGLTSRSEGVHDGDDGDDDMEIWLQKQNINKNIIILILGLRETL